MSPTSLGEKVLLPVGGRSPEEDEAMVFEGLIVGWLPPEEGEVSKVTVGLPWSRPDGLFVGGAWGLSSVVVLELPRGVVDSPVLRGGGC